MSRTGRIMSRTGSNHESNRVEQSNHESNRVDESGSNHESTGSNHE